MIHCHELRLGNYILVDKKLRKVTFINNDKSFADVPNVGFEIDNTSTAFESCSSDRLEAAPVTNEVLKSCNFIYHDYFKFWQLITNDSGIRSEMDIDPDFNVIDYMRRPLGLNLISLHQLQNIYYALKSRELVVRAKEIGVVSRESQRTPQKEEATVLT